MGWYVQSPKEVVKNLKSSRDGLSEVEVQKRFGEHGKNVLRKYKSRSKFGIFASQFKSLLVLILILASVVSVLIGHFLDAVIIIVIVFLNSGIGFFQEYKAEEIIEKLRKSLRYKVLVFRVGVQKEIDSKFLVPGDIVLLKEGDKILADCRVLESNGLKVNEAILTGESFPVDKNEKNLDGNVVLAERTNMLYAGTSVVRGKSTAIVVDTGTNTEFGKLAELVQITKDEKMPLEKKLDTFSKNISLVILLFVSLVFILGVFIGVETVEMFLVSVSLAIGAIPEGLPAIIAITLAVAIKKMYKTNTLVRKLPAVETLGRATVICTDKTGTLTEEELVVDKIYSGKLFSIDGLKKVGVSVKRTLEIGVLCNNARSEKDSILGDPTETALVKIAKIIGIDKKTLTEGNPRFVEHPFNSERKLMSIVREREGIFTSYVKGAPLNVLDKCTKEIVKGKIRLLNPKRKRELIKISKGMENDGLRVLGFGFRQISSKVNQENSENRLIFSGFVGMIDPPRKEVKDAIFDAINAGISVKIITGDSALTTESIAKKIGLMGKTIEGSELNELPEDKWDEVVRTKTIFARTTPQQKLKIVQILKNQNETVAVTGDGVNDILALKKADIGISMGLRGSDVARDSSDIVLLDDNFSSIIGGVKQGRRVFDNLKKSIKFLLAANFGEVFVVLIALILGLPLPFLPLAILWMNLVTDSLPALALSLEPAEKNVMKRKPRSDGLLSGIWKWIIFAGILMIISSLAIFNYGVENYGVEVARTMAITTAIFFELFFVFSCKSEDSLFKTGILNNKFLILAVLVSGGLHSLAIYTPLGEIFGFVALDSLQFSRSILAGFSGLIFFETWKLFRR